MWLTDNSILTYFRAPVKHARYVCSHVKEALAEPSYKVFHTLEPEDCFCQGTPAKAQPEGTTSDTRNYPRRHQI